MKLENITYYPIKSITGIDTTVAEVQPFGLKNDRMMMMVDSEGQFITQRKYPQLARIQLKQDNENIELTADNFPPLIINNDRFSEVSMPVVVWKDQCHGFKANVEVNQWLSDYLGFEVNLVRYDRANPRPIDPDYSKPTDTVSFADGFPLLVISQESLNDLNARLETPVSMRNFRPNIVVSGVEAFAEDNWKSITIGNVEFEAVKRCSRCILTTIDPITGIKNSRGEPLKTLSLYRRGPGGVIFGMNLIPKNPGTIQLNDSVSIK